MRGGVFTSIGGQFRNYIAAIDAATGNATTWEPNANSAVLTLAISGSTVYAGGFFTNIGGQTRKSIAALDASTGNATAWNPDANLVVRALAVSGSTVYAGGDFYNIAGQPRKHFAVINNTSDFCVNAIAPGTQYTTTGATGIGTAINLPPGLTAVWAANSLTISGKPTQTGTYDYSIPLTGGCGNVNTTGTITVKAEAPKVELAPTITVCEGSFIKIQPKYSYGLTVNADDIPGLTYQWSVPGTPDLTNTSVYESTVTTTGLYKLTVSAQGACEASAETNVSFVPAFDLAIVALDEFALTPQVGEAVTLGSQITPDNLGIATYLWTAGSFTIPDNTKPSISFVQKATQAELITLTASIGGCEKTATVTIEVYLTINSTFSPGGDGINDNLQATTSLDLSKAQWCIVSQTNADVACGLGPLNWDGTHYKDNSPCPAGEYLATIWVDGRKDRYNLLGKRNQFERTITLTR